MDIDEDTLPPPVPAAPHGGLVMPDADRQLVESVTAQRLGLVLNRYHGLIICLKCRRAIIPADIIKHVHMHASRLRCQPDDVQRLLEECGAPPVARLPPNWAYAIEAVDVIAGFVCRTCGSISSRRQNASRHPCSGKRDVASANLQRPFYGDNSRIFQCLTVVPPTVASAPTIDDIVTAEVAAAWAALRRSSAAKISTTTFKENLSFHRAYGTSQFVVNKSDDVLRGLSNEL